MNGRAKLDAEERRQELFAAVDWRCVVCGFSLYLGVPQLAHRVSKSKNNIDAWGSNVIHHPLNTVPVCSLRCNDAVSIGGHRGPGKALLERIVRITTGRESMPSLSDYYREVGEEIKANP